MSEPVEYQYRTRPDWIPEWNGWNTCSKESAQAYEKTPYLHDWHYEVRRLYTTPPQRKPLTDEDIKQDFEKWAKDNYVQGFEPYGDSYHNGHTRNRWQGWLAAHRFIEAAHGIKE